MQLLPDGSKESSAHTIHTHTVLYLKVCSEGSIESEAEPGLEPSHPDVGCRCTQQRLNQCNQCPNLLSLAVSFYTVSLFRNPLGVLIRTVLNL